MTNQHVKPLKLFDPKTDLQISEKFSASQIHSQSDDLSILEAEDELESTSSNAGKEFCSFKTDGAVIAGILNLENTLNMTVLLSANRSGTIHLLTPEGNNLKKLATSKVQGSILRTPAYADGILYCTTREGMVYAINTGLMGDASEGKRPLKPKLLWQQKMKKGILTEPVATGKLLIIATLGGLRCFEAYYQDEANKSIGKQLWAKGLSGVVSSPRLHSGNIFIGTEKSKLYAFDYGGNRASSAWVFKASGAIRTKPCISQRNSLVLATSIDGYVYAVDLRTGKYKWNFIAKSPIYSNIVSTSIGNEDHFFFGADNGVFYCINSQGKKIWAYKTNGKIRTEALIQGSRIYFGSEDNTLYALNLKTGKEVFTYSTDGNINSQPIIVNDIIYFGSTDSFIHGVYI